MIYISKLRLTLSLDQYVQKQRRRQPFTKLPSPGFEPTLVLPQDLKTGMLTIRPWSQHTFSESQNILLSQGYTSCQATTYFVHSQIPTPPPVQPKMRCIYELIYDLICSNIQDLTFSGYPTLEIYLLPGRCIGEGLVFTGYVHHTPTLYL